MSCYLAISGQDVWNPSNRVAEIFVGHARVVARAYSMESGIGEIIDDECEIDHRLFLEFISSLATSHERSNNQPLRELLEGVITVGLVLLARAGDSLDGVGIKEQAYWQERSARVAAGMPPG
ncbi:DUF6086 family protein [Streptomyces sp. NBC_00690]|uniref:DUF6086 family protein n=1 Tax=Streptomyces sp. NBC_00690 TaxID=2975808 RepID=UPI002E2CBFB1|nr:DUF6086 family protein [Streptomyces sp. NBC_00690]